MDAKMKHVVLYDQKFDTRPFGFLQAEYIYAAKVRKSQEWAAKHPLLSIFVKGTHSAELTPGYLVHGMCRGMVFFIFKMLYSAQPDGGFFWSNKYLAHIRDPIVRYTRLDDEKSERTMNPLLDELLLFCLKMATGPLQLSPWQKAMVATIITKQHVHSSPTIETGLSGGRAALIELRTRLKDAYHKYTEYIVESLHSVDALPGSVTTTDMKKIVEILQQERVVTTNPALVRMLMMRIGLIPHSFWFFIHHFAHTHELKNVCFPFLNAAMDIQKTLYSHAFESKPYFPFITLGPLQRFGKESFSNKIDNATLALLYDKLVRPTSVSNFPVQTACILQICPESKFNYSAWTGPTVQHPLTEIIDIQLPNALSLCPPTPIVTTDIGHYGINYFMEISIECSRTAHSICCWEQVDRAVLPTQTSTYIFDPNNGLWQLEAPQTTGAGIVEFLHTHAKFANEKSFLVKIIVFRGFGYV